MFDHPIIDVGLGLIFLYVILSLLASSVQEWIASIFGLRSRNLRAGIKNFVGEDYALKIYNHPLIRSLSKDKKLPSYIKPDTLSKVLLDVLAKDDKDESRVTQKTEGIRPIIRKINDDHPLKEILEALIDDGAETYNNLQANLANWFDEGMSRISGWYKRKVKGIIFLIAALVVVVTNASSIHIAEELWQNEHLRLQIAAQAQLAVDGGINNISAIEQIENQTFPIGWKGSPENLWDFLKMLLGWIITAAAVSLGAPFWFDLLSKVANLRGSGGQVQTKSPS